MKGIYFQKEFQRFYPDNQLAAQVLGYVGVDDNGLGGLEEKFDGELHGRPGLMYAAMDARRKVLGSSERDPQPGRNLMLTIDENIQFMAERALDHAMQKTQALNGTVVVQDAHTGQILALAIRPTFNPNQFRHTNPGAPARPRCQRCLRARFHLQAGHLCRGDGREGGHARRHDRLPRRPDQSFRPRPFTTIKSERGIGTVSGGHGARALQRRGVSSSWRSNSAPTVFTTTFAALASASARASSCPAKREGCCVRSNTGSRLPSATSPLGRKKPSRLCNWSPWSPPSPMEARIFLRTSSCRAGREPPNSATAQSPAAADRPISAAVQADFRSPASGAVQAR